MKKKKKQNKRTPITTTTPIESESLVTRRIVYGRKTKNHRQDFFNARAWFLMAKQRYGVYNECRGIDNDKRRVRIIKRDDKSAQRERNNNEMLRENVDDTNNNSSTQARGLRRIVTAS